MTVYLVGAGLGDPDLITLRARNLISLADVILYDRLIDDRIFDFCSENTILINVGKTRKDMSETIEQQNINLMLIEYGKKYKRVVRLKGGDPFLFGRGGEEALALESEGIDFEVIPGISSALAAPLLAGIPVTHRGISRGTVILTGHEIDDVALEHIAQTAMTIVILMGVAKRQSIAERLQAAGLSGDTKVAICQNSSTVLEKNQVVKLSDLGKTEVTSPAVFVIGEVAGLNLKRKYPNNDKPLYGKTVVVTRSRHQSLELIDLLRDKGAKVICAPAIAILPPEDLYAKLKVCLDDLPSYAWIIFTSSNAVDAFFQFIPDVRILHKIKIASIGSETSKRLASRGIVPDLIPGKSSGEALAEEFSKILEDENITGKILIPRSAIAKNKLVEGLSRLGLAVDVAEAYRTVDNKISDKIIAQIQSADIVTFTSPSTVHSFLRQVGKEDIKLAASIGPETTAALRACGIDHCIESETPAMHAMSEAICRKFYI